MTVAQHINYTPSICLLGPDDYEFGDALAATGRQLAEAMLALFDRAKILDWKYAEGRRDQLAPDLSADVFACVRHDRVAIKGCATSIVEKGNLGIERSCECFEVAAIVSVEYLRIQRPDLARQRVGDRGRWINGEEGGDECDR